MKTIILDTYSEMLSEVGTIFNENDSIEIIADREFAERFLKRVYIDLYSDHDVTFDDNEDLYIIGRSDYSYFSIEPLMGNSGIPKVCGAETIVILEDIEDDSIKNYDRYDVREIIVGYIDDDMEDESEEDFCEIDYSNEEEAEIILDAMAEIMESDYCQKCLEKILIELTDKFYNIGYTDAKDEVKAYIDGMD